MNVLPRLGKLIVWTGALLLAATLVCLVAVDKPSALTVTALAVSTLIGLLCLLLGRVLRAVSKGGTPEELSPPPSDPETAGKTSPLHPKQNPVLVAMQELPKEQNAEPDVSAHDSTRGDRHQPVY